MPIEVPNRDEWFQMPDGLPKPDWPAINDWLKERLAPEQRNEATGQITEYWLARLACALGSQYVVDSAKYYVVLSDLGKEGRHRLTDFLDQTCTQILQSLGPDAQLDTPRKWAIVRLPDMDTNFKVLPTLCSDGDSTAPTQEFFGADSDPFIYSAEGATDEFSSFLAPLTCHILSHLPLPAWLDIGFTFSLVASLAKEPEETQIDDKMMAEHRARWNERSIQEFWSGKFFTDELWYELSINLAQALFDLVKRELKRDPEGLQRLICRANAADAGEAAVRQILGRSLATFVAAFLGPGNWSPNPSKWEMAETEA